MLKFDPRRSLRSGRLLLWPLIAFVVALLFSLKDSGVPSWLAGGTESLETMTLVSDPSCDPQGKFCNALGDGTVALALRLGAASQPLHPFPATVQVRGLAPEDVERVRVRFAMSGMDMGPNLYALLRQPDNTWVGQVTLPICTTGRLDWLAEVSVVSGGREYRAQFPFQMHRP